MIVNGGKRRLLRVRRASLAVLITAAWLLPSLPTPALADAIDEVHYTYTSVTSVAFDWRGGANDIRYGLTASYGNTVTASTPSPLPFSSAGPFWEATLTGLSPGTTYHYSIGGGPDQTFSTVPTGSFRFDVEADIGSSLEYPNVTTIQNQIAADNPAFVLGVGDLTYGQPFGQTAVDQHFNDAMAWSRNAAYLPVWGNHEWEDSTRDDLRNYKGRFALPNSQTSSSAPAPGCCGEDWSWFDAGGVRFISYPEPYTQATWTEWQAKADLIMAQAQADPSIRYIVTFGHRPAYSTGFHPGDPRLSAILDGFGDQYPKYVLNLNGHSHDYERFQPIHRVTHITSGGAGSTLETPWTSTDPRTAFRAFHQEYLRVDVGTDGMRIEAVCGPATSRDDISCVPGSVIDSYAIGTPPPPPPPSSSTIYVDKANPNCLDQGGNGSASQPFCTIVAAAKAATLGKTVIVSSGTYSGQVIPNSGTALSPIVFAAAPGASVTVTQGGPKDKYGFYISSKNYITVLGFNITGTTGDGLYLSKSDHISLIENHVSYSGKPTSGQTAKGIRLSNTTNSLVSGNTVDHNSDYGIYLVDGSTGNTVVGNRVYANAQVFQRAASGIRLYGSPGNVVSSNVTHDNEDSGIELYTGSNNNVVVNNVSYNNGDHGIDNYSSTGDKHISNSLYNNQTAGINAEGGSTGTTIRNNISVDNGIGSTRTESNIRVDAQSTSGSSMDYDLVNLRTTGTLLIWASTKYTSLSSFKSATGQETHGISADPRWAAPGAGDFHLSAGSPAIDSANSGSPGETTADADGNPRVDDPLSANTGAGSRLYDDRGAYEFQPEVTDLPPAASLAVSPSSGTAPLAVTADASASTDTDATPIASYRFDFGDGSAAVGPQAGATATHTYTSAGTFTVAVTVKDTAGLASTATTEVTVKQNLVGNSGFETDTAGWNTSGSGTGVTLARVPGGHSGGWAAKLANTGTSATTCTLNDSPNWVASTSTGSYTGSIWVRGDVSGAVFNLRFREYSGATLLGSRSTQMTLTTSWQLVTVTYTPVSPNSSTLDFNAYLPASSAPPGTCFYADDVSITRG